jgi:hypothetical protein
MMVEGRLVCLGELLAVLLDVRRVLASLLWQLGVLQRRSEGVK